MKEGPIGVRRYWTIGCLAIVLTVLCGPAVPDKAGPVSLVGPLIELVGCAILVLIARRRLGAKANLAFIGPAAGAAILWAVYLWTASANAGPKAGPTAWLGVTLLGVAMGAVLQFLIVGFIGQGGRTKA
ncbi:hypothetical protein DMC25_14180 [Caulobacter sp. D4A]|uniref:hypothetical protein n=1 Tax=unclassified Caulobacter TaxID=2648921 RepID=UPI000D735907|nr:MULTISPECIES: hypothetical protein [unclassified Caulobacter]PXA86334.1 hypothetical protein DMC25_14180 [Caulobacter sp. D4A]PXA90474.1 hypothetical protein DMC18_14675 [Caulobacter sp. D5]